MNLKAIGLFASVALTLAACSTQPTAPSAPAAAPAPAATPATAPAGALAPAAATPAANAENLPVLNRTLIAAGYKATTINSEIFYCRQVDVTGTSFKKKVCLTEAQLKAEERKIKEMQDQMIRTQANPSCMGPTC